MKTPQEIYARFAHEFGHIVLKDKFHSAPEEVQLDVEEKYAQFRTDVEGKRMGAVVAKRDNAIIQDRFGKAAGHVDAYWIAFEEWFAEQVAKWATTSEKPLNVVDKFFQALGRKIREVVTKIREKLGGKGSVEPSQVLNDWLDSFMSDVAPFAQKFAMERDVKTTRKNRAKLRKAGVDDSLAAPMSASTISQREALKKLYPDGVPPDIDAVLPIADNVHRWHKLGAAIWQMARLNPRLRPLQLFKEALEGIDRDMKRGEARPYETLKLAQKLSQHQQAAVNDLFEAYMNLDFLTPEEHKTRVRRRPSEVELKRMAKDHKVNDAGLVVFAQMLLDLDWSLDTWADLRKQTVLRNMTDPGKIAAALEAIDQDVANKKAAPYFPLGMRYGRYAVGIRNKAGALVYVDTVESARKQKALIEALKGQVKEGEYVVDTVFDRSIAMLTAVYSGMVDQVEASGFKLGAAQRAALEWIKVAENPAEIYRTRLRLRPKKADRARELFRLYTNFFVHGARYQARFKHSAAMTESLKAMETLSNSLTGTNVRDLLPDADLSEVRKQENKLRQIHGMMVDAREYLMNVKSEWVWMRGIAFHWYLGANVASAMLNLSQIPIFTGPFLASKFGGFLVGDSRAATAIAKATLQVRSTFKPAKKMEHSNLPIMKFLSKAVSIGKIKEAMAPEMAGMAEGNNLIVGFGGNVTQRTLYQLGQLSGKMFSWSEQANRRITFRAALELGLKHPEVKFLDEAVTKHPGLFEELKLEGWSDTDARAFIGAVDTVDQTQGVYSKDGRPKFLRGKVGSTLFVFYSFPQQMILTMMANKSMAVRSLLLMGAVAGFMGLPGAEDLLEVVRGIAYLAKIDFNPEVEIRRFVHDVLGWEGDSADLILHGVGREGFGIPAVMEMFGVPFPEVDRSRSVGMGQLLPVNPGSFIAGIGETVAQASGATLGIPFQVMNAMTDNRLRWGDPKLWEYLLPRALSNATQAVRIVNEGSERNRLGAEILEFDRSDPLQFAEILAIGLGYQPTRLSRYWDNLALKNEVKMFWEMRRNYLLAQLDATIRTDDQEGRDIILEQIREYNAELPVEARGMALTSESIRSSLQQRARTRAEQEAGVAPTRTTQPIWNEIDRLFPPTHTQVVR